MEIDKKSKYILTFCIGLLVGFGLGVQGYWEKETKTAFERGRAQGHEECDDPSRLEKAAKWLTE